MSNWKKSESWKNGQSVESNFAKLLEQRDPDFRKSTREEQFKHIDYHSFFGTIDVKAKKRLNRLDSKGQDDFVWLEFKNIHGNVGWLCGETDIIAFERNNDFVLVSRSKLLAMAKDKCDLNTRVTYSKNALYKGYQRKGRKDLISIVKMGDVLSIPHRIWSKEQKFS